MHERQEIYVKSEITDILDIARPNDNVVKKVKVGQSIDLPFTRQSRRKKVCSTREKPLQVEKISNEILMSNDGSELHRRSQEAEFMLPLGVPQIMSSISEPRTSRFVRSNSQLANVRCNGVAGSVINLNGEVLKRSPILDPGGRRTHLNALESTRNGSEFTTRICSTQMCSNLTETPIIPEKNVTLMGSSVPKSNKSSCIKQPCSNHSAITNMETVNATVVSETVREQSSPNSLCIPSHKSVASPKILVDDQTTRSSAQEIPHQTYNDRYSPPRPSRRAVSTERDVTSEDPISHPTRRVKVENDICLRLSNITDDEDDSHLTKKCTLRKSDSLNHVTANQALLTQCQNRYPLTQDGCQSSLISTANHKIFNLRKRNSIGETLTMPMVIISGDRVEQTLQRQMQIGEKIELEILRREVLGESEELQIWKEEQQDETEMDRALEDGGLISDNELISIEQQSSTDVFMDNLDTTNALMRRLMQLTARRSYCSSLVGDSNSRQVSFVSSSHANSTKRRKWRFSNKKPKGLPEVTKKYLEIRKQINKGRPLNKSKRTLYSKGYSDSESQTPHKSFEKGKGCNASTKITALPPTPVTPPARPIRDLRIPCRNTRNKTTSITSKRAGIIEEISSSAVECPTSEVSFKKPTLPASRMLRKKQRRRSSEKESLVEVEGLRRSKRGHVPLKQTFVPFLESLYARIFNKADNAKIHRDSNSRCNHLNHGRKARTTQPMRKDLYSYLGDTNTTSGTITTVSNSDVNLSTIGSVGGKNWLSAIESEVANARVAEEKSKTIACSEMGNTSHTRSTRKAVKKATAGKKNRSLKIINSVIRQKKHTLNKAVDREATTVPVGTTENTLDLLKNVTTGAGTSSSTTCTDRKRKGAKNSTSDATHTVDNPSAQICKARETSQTITSESAANENKAGKKTSVLEHSRVYLPPALPLDQLNDMFDELKNAANKEDTASSAISTNRIRNVRVRVCRVQHGSDTSMPGASISSERDGSRTPTTQDATERRNDNKNLLLSWLKGAAQLQSATDRNQVFMDMRYSAAGKLIFTDLEGIDYAFYDTDEKASLGYLRFKPMQIKPTKRAKKYHLHFVVLAGEFHIGTERENGTFCVGDMVAINIGCRYTIKNLEDDIGILMVIKK